MDRALQERVVGAAVLVFFIVLVVPVFLDGPAEETPTVSESVTLPGQNGQQRRRQTIVLERDRSEPVPAATPAAAGQREIAREPVPADTPAEAPVADSKVARSAAADETPLKATAAPPKETAPEEPQPPPAITKSETGLWAVQLGSFSQKENADRLAAELRGKGYAAFLSRMTASGSALHRVRIGPQSDRDSAEAVSTQLRKDGIESQVVPHP